MAFSKGLAGDLEVKYAGLDDRLAELDGRVGSFVESARVHLDVTKDVSERLDDMEQRLSASRARLPVEAAPEGENGRLPEEPPSVADGRFSEEKGTDRHAEAQGRRPPMEELLSRMETSLIDRLGEAEQALRAEVERLVAAREAQARRLEEVQATMDGLTVFRSGVESSLRLLAEALDDIRSGAAAQRRPAPARASYPPSAASTSSRSSVGSCPAATAAARITSASSSPPTLPDTPYSHRAAAPAAGSLKAPSVESASPASVPRLSGASPRALTPASPESETASPSSPSPLPPPLSARRSASAVFEFGEAAYSDPHSDAAKEVLARSLSFAVDRLAEHCRSLSDEVERDSRNPWITALSEAVAASLDRGLRQPGPRGAVAHAWDFLEHASRSPGGAGMADSVAVVDLMAELSDAGPNAAAVMVKDAKLASWVRVALNKRALADYLAGLAGLPPALVEAWL
eukprot:tig00001085_g6950.t1